MLLQFNDCKLFIPVSETNCVLWRRKHVSAANSTCNEKQFIVPNCEKQIDIIIYEFVSHKGCFCNLPFFWKEVRIIMQKLATKIKLSWISLKVAR